MKEGWTRGKFSDIFDLQMGKTPSRDNPSYWGGTNAWVSIADMNCGKYINDTKECITDSAISDSGIHLVCKDTVIMSFKLSIGKTAIASKDIYTNEAIMSFNTKEGYNILPDYIYYYLKGYKWQGMNKAVMGMTLNKKTISNNFFSFPHVSEQQHIVEELDLLSSIIEKKKAQLIELDNLAQSLFYEMFGDPISNEKGWDLRSIGEVCSDMTKGPFGSDIKKSLYVPKSKDTYKVYIQINAILKDASLGNYYISKEYFESKMKRFEVKPNDYIITCDGTLGKYLRLPHEIERGIISASLLRLTLNDNITPKYFELLWDLYILQELLKDTRNTALVHLPAASKISIFSIPLPPLNIQQQFASKIDTIEHQKELIKQSIKEVETLFNSRMDYYFN